MFNEDNTTEQMIISTLCKNGWTYIAPENLPRHPNDVMVESMVRDALIRLNPEIAEDESRADDVIHKLRTIVLSTNEHNLITQNELFKTVVFENNSYPFGQEGQQVPVDFFGTEINGKLNQNEYVVTNQWVYPKADGGKRLDIVLLINGFPVVVGEVKTPVRAAVTWLDGAQDISDYERSVPDKTLIKADGEDLVFVKVSLVDKDGYDVPTAENRIFCSLEGDGEIVATDNGDPTCLITFSEPSRPAFNGLFLAIVKAKRDGNKPLRLTIEADGLEKATVDIEIDHE